MIKPLRQHRHFTESARKAILAQIDKGELSVSSASRAYGVAGNTIYKRQSDGQSKKTALLAHVKELR